MKADREGAGSALRAQWRARLKRFEKRKGAAAAFCEAEGVSVWSLYDWRRRLTGQSRSKAHRRAPAAQFVAAGTLSAPAAPFVEAGTLSAPGRRAVADSSGLPAGLELRIEPGGAIVFRILGR